MHTPLGVKATTMTVHMLQHLPNSVELWGPLWAYSCFHLESTYEWPSQMSVPRYQGYDKTSMYHNITVSAHTLSTHAQ